MVAIVGPQLTRIADLGVGDRVGFILNTNLDWEEIADWAMIGGGRICLGFNAMSAMQKGRMDDLLTYEGEVYYVSKRGHIQIVPTGTKPKRSQFGDWAINAIDVIDVDADSDDLFEILYIIEKGSASE